MNKLFIAAGEGADHFDNYKESLIDVQTAIIDTRLTDLDSEVTAPLVDEGKTYKDLSTLPLDAAARIKIQEAFDQGRPYVIVTSKRKGYLVVKEGETYRLKKLDTLPDPNKRADDLAEIV